MHYTYLQIGGASTRRLILSVRIKHFFGARIAGRGRFSHGETTGSAENPRFLMATSRKSLIVEKSTSMSHPRFATSHRDFATSPFVDYLPLPLSFLSLSCCKERRKKGKKTEKTHNSHATSLKRFAISQRRCLFFRPRVREVCHVFLMATSGTINSIKSIAYHAFSAVAIIPLVALPLPPLRRAR